MIISNEAYGAIFISNRSVLRYFKTSVFLKVLENYAWNDLNKLQNESCAIFIQAFLMLISICLFLMLIPKPLITRLSLTVRA